MATNEVSEVWRLCDTGTWSNPRHEVSSMGKVRKVNTGEILEIGNATCTVPHYRIDGAWWRPDVLVNFVFREQVKTIVAPVEPAVIHPVKEIRVDNFAPKAEYKSRKKRQQARDRGLVEPETPSPEYQLAEMLYKPYVTEQKLSATSSRVQTHQDHAAQEVSAKRDQPVHGVAQVLNLYRMSAKKRGHVWELTDKQAIALMVSSCRYCGCDPGTHNLNGLNGIDRADSSQGYIESNVVPCCGKCNMMKGMRTPDEFLGHVASIVEYQDKKQVFA